VLSVGGPSDVETAMWEPIRGDTRRRHLEIDGPSRLIRFREDANVGLQRLRGTRVSLALVRGGRSRGGESRFPPTFAEINDYLGVLCLDLPYRLTIEHVEDGKTTTTFLDAQPLRAYLPSPFAEEGLQIPVNDSAVGLEGEIVIVPNPAVTKLNLEKLAVSSVRLRPRLGTRTEGRSRQG